MPDSNVTSKEFMLLALQHGIVPRTTREAGDTHVSENTARILADGIRSGQTFSSFEGNDEVQYPETDAPDQRF